VYFNSVHRMSVTPNAYRLLLFLFESKSFVLAKTNAVLYVARTLRRHSRSSPCWQRCSVDTVRIWFSKRKREKTTSGLLLALKLLLFVLLLGVFCRVSFASVMFCCFFLNCFSKANETQQKGAACGRQGIQAQESVITNFWGFVLLIFFCVVRPTKKRKSS
jgi:hypothetical protein